MERLPPQRDVFFEERNECENLKLKKCHQSSAPRTLAPQRLTGSGEDERPEGLCCPLHFTVPLEELSFFRQTAELASVRRVLSFQGCCFLF